MVSGRRFDGQKWPQGDYPSLLRRLMIPNIEVPPEEIIFGKVPTDPMLRAMEDIEDGVISCLDS